MIDVHSHLLPGVDDGSRSVEQSVEVLGRFAAAGVTDVILTPHIKASGILDYGEEMLTIRQEAYTALSADAPGEIRLHLGFEIMLDDVLGAKELADRRYSLASSRYYLVEFHPSVAMGSAANVIAYIAHHNVIPVVAHPERYAQLNAAAAAVWVERGAKFAVDATTLTEASRRGKRARMLLNQGLVALVAADNHGGQRSIVTAARFLEERECKPVVDALTRGNPQAILDDGEMTDVPPVELPERFFDSVKMFLGG